MQELQASPFAAANRAFSSPQLPPIKLSQDPSVPKPGSPCRRVSTLRSIVEVAPSSEGSFPASPGTPASTNKVCRWPPVIGRVVDLQSTQQSHTFRWGIYLGRVDRQSPAGGHVEVE